MRRWKKFLHNTVEVLADLRGLLMEFHILIGLLMLTTLAVLEFWHVVSRIGEAKAARGGTRSFRLNPS